MKCMTADGLVRHGIKLWFDPPAKYTLHMAPDFWMGVSDAVLQSDCVQREGDDMILMRCSIVDRTIVPETAADAALNKVFVSGVIDKRQVAFSDAVPEPAQYRTALGPNSYCPYLAVRHNNRVMGKTIGHEEYRFVAVMSEGDHFDSNVIFYKEDGSPLNLWASGPLLSYSGGELAYQHPRVILATDRFRK